jgi:hypothetical protein
MTTIEDEGRVEQKSSLRIKLFKETSRQSARQSAPEPGRSVREEWDRRQSIRTRMDLIRDHDRSLRS